MTNIPQVKIVNAETGIEIVRDANEVELAQMEKDAQEAILLEKAFENRKAAKAQAEAKLEALGLTPADLRALGLQHNLYRLCQAVGLPRVSPSGIGLL